MATGGHHSDGKDVRQKMELCNNGNNMVDRITGLPWPSLPNNLELNTRSKPTKKQRNREKSRSTIVSENIVCSPRTNTPTNKFQELCFPSTSNEQLPPTKRNIKRPVNHRLPLPTFQRPSNATMENGSPAKDEYVKNQMSETAIKERLAHLQDCIAQVTSVLQQLKQSEDPTHKIEVPQLEQMRNMLVQDEQNHMELFCQQFLNENATSNYDDNDSDSDGEPYISSAMDINPVREVNGVVDLSEEDKADIQNHLLEKMKVSQEKLTAIKQQHSLLLSMRKNAEEKLAAFQAELVNMGDESPQLAPDWKFGSESNVEVDNAFPNVDVGWKMDQSTGQNSQKLVKNGPKTFLGDSEEAINNQGINSIQVNLESIKRRLEVLQDCSDARNVVEQLSPIEPLSPAEPAGGENLSDKLLAVHWQRKKLKNKLLELQEKKKASDELMKELSLIKEAATTVEHLNSEDSSFSIANVQDVPDLSLHDENDGMALEAMRETISQLRGMLSTRNASSETDSVPTNFSNASAQGDTLSKQNSYRASPGKRDNIKKGRSDQFPARRHYEAEGRANEDADVPAAPPPVVPPPADADAQGKKRRLQLVKEKQQLLQTMLDTIKGKMDHFPGSVLQAMSSLDNDEGNDSSDTETATDNEDSQGNDDSSSAIEARGSSMVKEEDESVELIRRPQDTERPETSSMDQKHLEELKSERERLLKLHQKFSRLQDEISSSSKQNNREMRSSGEGGNLQKKSRLSHSVSLSNHLPSQSLRQENLLTLQNVESQNRNNSSNITHNSNPTLKKDNINDLSAKFNKPGAPYAARATTGFMFKFGTDVKAFHDPTANKPQIADIMKRDRNKLQNYSRNSDIPIHSSSSMNSEPMDGSSSVVAQDTTAAATWGGSSTQENFEDENEAFGSLGDPEEEGAESMAASAPKAYSNATQYANYSVDSSTKRRDNRLNKYFKSTQLNQWSCQKKNSIQNESQRNQQTPENVRDSRIDEMTQSVAGNFSTAHPMPRQDRFLQKLYEQLDSLKDAIGRSVVVEPSAPPAIPRQTVPPFGQESSGHLNMQYPNSYAGIPDFSPNYTHQMQLQQQLLLSLSQCYHALYVQQLEIQHLHRRLQQGTETNAAFGSSCPEDVTQPWMAAPSFINPALSSVPFPHSQISPASAPAFISANPQVFTFNSGVAAAENASTSASSSMAPARAVVHPAAQDTRSNSETLNNQVAPRTRANNYWDNLRSNSRQNLLSANASKSKDSQCSSGGPQVRQVHPLIPNESNWNRKSKVFIPPHTDSIVSSTSASNASVPFQSAERSRLTEYHGTIPRTKKPNQNRQASHSLPDSSGAAIYNPCTETVQPYRPFPEDSSLRNRSANSSTINSGANSHPSMQQLPGNILSEVSKLFVQNTGQERCLEELLRELCCLKSESLQNAVGAVRELASMERRASSLSNIDHNSPQSRTHDLPQLSQENNARPDAPTFLTSDVTAVEIPSDNIGGKTIQNWPPATIIPLGKNMSRPSVGAITKPMSRNGAPSSSCSSSSQMTPEPQISEDRAALSPIVVVERIMVDIVASIQSHVTQKIEDAFIISLSLEAVNSFKNHTKYKSLCQKELFILQLHQEIVNIIRKRMYSLVCAHQLYLVESISEVMLRKVTLLYKLSDSEKNASTATGNLQADTLPSTSNETFNDVHKLLPITPREQPEVTLNADSIECNPAQECDSASVELYVNMPAEDENLQVHCSRSVEHEQVRGAVGGSSASGTSNWSNHDETEDTYECDPGAETEPEVEAGTEADLAEADQSPGQQIATNGMDEDWHILQPDGAQANAASSLKEIAVNAISSSDHVINSLSPAQGACNIISTESEITIDDIPTKLTTLSQEELQRQIGEEQEAIQLQASLHLQDTEDINLVGNGDSLKDPPTFI